MERATQRLFRAGDTGGHAALRGVWLVLLMLVACSAPDPTPTPDRDRDADTYPASEDCDDLDPYTYPGADETCDGLDNDCDLEVDEGVLTTFYIDLDSDGVGGQASGACEAIAPLVTEGGDCDDSRADVYPGAEEICGLDGGDEAADEDCDGLIDEGGEGVFYPDRDSDGYGVEAEGGVFCGAPDGYVSLPGDCNDADAAINPDGEELCTAAGLTPEDEDCDGLVDADDPDALGAQTGYLDLDGDGYGDPDTLTVSCDLPDGYVVRGGDCDDAESEVHLGALEICDGLDNDCDGAADDADPGLINAPTWYADVDEDAHGDADVASESCLAPEGYVASPDDCDDSDPSIHADADERCDTTADGLGLDEDCDGAVDEAGSPSAPQWYLDVDQDTYGDANISQRGCLAPGGYVLQAGDCDNGDGTSYPGAPERAATEVDEDCDGRVDEQPGDGDSDGDGIAAWDGDCDDTDPAISPLAPEIWGDGLDNDCDGHVDADRYVSPVGATPEGDKPVHTTLQAALDSASDGELIAAAPGTYRETLDFGGKGVALVSMEGPVGTEIDAEGAGSAVRFASGEGPEAEIRGFTISGGNGVGCPASVPAGGGVCIVDASPTITLNLVEGNSATRGGGIYVSRGGPTLVQNRIRQNSATEGGGGIYLEYAAAVVIGGDVSQNEGGLAGGGVMIAYSSPAVRGVSVEGNSASFGGGIGVMNGSPVVVQGVVVGNNADDGAGIASDGEEPTLVACILTGNVAAESGGGAFFADSAGHLLNVTVAGNTAGAGGGVAIEGSQVVELRHNILAFNSALNGPTASLAPGGATPSRSYNLYYDASSGGAGLSGIAEGVTDLIADPLFVNDPADEVLDDDDYRLQEGSPAINAGENKARYSDPDGTRCDLGAYGGPWALIEPIGP